MGSGWRKERSVVLRRGAAVHQQRLQVAVDDRVDDDDHGDEGIGLGVTFRGHGAIVPPRPAGSTGEGS